MAEAIKSPRVISNEERDIRNHDRNVAKDDTSKVLFPPTNPPTDPPKQHKISPKHIRLLPGEAPFDPSASQRWIDTFEYNEETDETQSKHYDARYNNDNWHFNEDTNMFVRVVIDLTAE